MVFSNAFHPSCVAESGIKQGLRRGRKKQGFCISDSVKSTELSRTHRKQTVPRQLVVLPRHWYCFTVSFLYYWAYMWNGSRCFSTHLDKCSSVSVKYVFSGSIQQFQDNPHHRTQSAIASAMPPIGVGNGNDTLYLGLFKITWTHSIYSIYLTQHTKINRKWLLNVTQTDIQPRTDQDFFSPRLFFFGYAHALAPTPL